MGRINWEKFTRITWRGNNDGEYDGKTMFIPKSKIKFPPVDKRVVGAQFETFQWNGGTWRGVIAEPLERKRKRGRKFRMKSVLDSSCDDRPLSLLKKQVHLP